VNSSQDINLVQFAGEPGHATVVWRALGKTNQLAGVIFHDKAKPTVVPHRKRLLPLALTELIRRPFGAPAAVRFVERPHMQSRQSASILSPRRSNVKGHSTSATQRSRSGRAGLRRLR